MFYLARILLSRTGGAAGITVGLTALWALAGNHVEWVTPLQIYFSTWLLWHLLRLFWPIIVIFFLVTHSQYLQR